jgi:hypothetical protein
MVRVEEEVFIGSKTLNPFEQKSVEDEGEEEVIIWMRQPSARDFLPATQPLMAMEAHFSISLTINRTL